MCARSSAQRRRAACRTLVCRGLSGAVLALALITMGGRAWGQAPSTPGVTMEHAATLIQAHAYDRAAVMLRQLLAANPANRGA